jgi:hypothetical protein
VDAVNRGGLTLAIVAGALQRGVLQPAEEAGGDRLGPVIDVVGTDFVAEVGEE